MELEERVGTDVVGRLEIWMVGVATVAIEEIDCSCIVTFAAAAARSCKYNRCHCNNVGLPSDNLTRGRR